MIRKKIFFSLLALVVCHSMDAMNLLRPYDPLVRPDPYTKKNVGVFVWGEAGLKHAQGFNCDGRISNVLQIWNERQDALTMLNGFDACSDVGQLRILVDATDDCVRGNFKVQGDLELLYGGAAGLQYYFYPGIWAGFYVPFFSQKLSNVFWQDLTQDVTVADARVRQFLTSDIFTLVNQLGDGLDLFGWTRTGLGDATFLLEWFKVYPQARPVLSEIALDGRFGFSVPTGLRADEDKIFALPFGYDGAFAVIAGGGLRATWGNMLRAGFDIELQHAFGSTRCRRIKTCSDQTELLLLAKTSAYKDFGLNQRYDLYAQFFNFLGGLSLMAGYQYYKHGEDRLSLSNYDYSNSIANTAISLEEWTRHEMVFNVRYDFNYHLGDCAPVIPHCSGFVRLPFNGKRVALFTTAGFEIGMYF